MKNLVLLWGWNRNEKSYQKLINSAPKDWKIYQISYPELMPTLKREELYQNLLKFLKQHNLKKTYLLGHSLGGALALDFAFHHPEAIETLFLIDTEGIDSQEPVWQAMFNLLLYSHKYREGLRENTQALSRTMKNPIFHARLGWLAHRYDLQKEAENLKVKTQIFWAENDKITPLWQGQKLQQLIKGSKLTVISDEGHDWIIYGPEKFWSSVV